MMEFITGQYADIVVMLVATASLSALAYVILRDSKSKDSARVAELSKLKAAFDVEAERLRKMQAERNIKQAAE